MAKPLVSDELWQRIEPLLPQPKPRRFRFPGRKPLDYRKVLTGIIFVLKTGIPWEELPQEMGCGCGMTCLNYLNAWQRAGVWEKLHQILLAELEQADKLDWSRAAVDSAKARALGRRSDRPQSDGSRQTRDQAPCPDRGSRRAAGDPQHRGQRARRQRAAAAGRRHPAGAPQGGPPPRSPGQPVRRPGLRLTAASPGVGGAGLIPTCAASDRTRQWPGGLSLGGGADLVVAAQLSQAPVADRSRGPVHDAFVSLASALICMWFL